MAVDLALDQDRLRGVEPARLAALDVAARIRGLAVHEEEETAAADALALLVVVGTIDFAPVYDRDAADEAGRVQVRLRRSDVDGLVSRDPQEADGVERFAHLLAPVDLVALAVVAPIHLDREPGLAVEEAGTDAGVARLGGRDIGRRRGPVPDDDLLVVGADPAHAHLDVGLVLLVLDEDVVFVDDDLADLVTIAEGEHVSVDPDLDRRVGVAIGVGGVDLVLLVPEEESRVGVGKPVRILLRFGLGSPVVSAGPGAALLVSGENLFGRPPVGDTDLDSVLADELDGVHPGVPLFESGIPHQDVARAGHGDAALPVDLTTTAVRIRYGDDPVIPAADHGERARMSLRTCLLKH